MVTTEQSAALKGMADKRINASGPVTPPGVSTPNKSDNPAGFDPEVVEAWCARVCAAAGKLAMGMCFWLDLVADFEKSGAWSGHGIRHCAHWLSWACSLSPGTAREHVRVARAIQDLPLVHEEFAAGRLSYAKVRELTRVADRVEERVLVDLARDCTASQLERAVRGFRHADPDRLSSERRRRARWFTDDHGMVVLTARLPAEEGAVLVAALEMAMAALTDAETKRVAAPQGGASTVTASQDAVDDDSAPFLRDGPDAGDTVASANCGPPVLPPGFRPVSAADSLVEVARGFLDGAGQDRSGEDRNLVVVHVDAEVLASAAAHLPRSTPTSELLPTSDDVDVRADDEDAADVDNPSASHHANDHDHSPLADDVPPMDLLDRSAVPAHGACRIAGVGGVTAATAARLACDAVVVGIVRRSGGAVLAHGRRRRTVSPAQRRALLIRDGGCCFPACGRTTHLDAHHAQHWLHGGVTDLSNLLLLCRFHHMVVHEAAIAITPSPSTAPIPHQLASRACWLFRNSTGVLLTGERLGIGPPTDEDEFLLEDSLDRVRSWDDPEAAAIRPRWAGEAFSLAATVSVLFSALKDEPAPDNADSFHLAA